MRGRATRHSIAVEAPYFPDRLVEMVQRKDPVAQPYDRGDPTNPFFGKKIFVMSGAADKIVPWAASQDFVEKLAVGSGGVKRVMVQEGAGHECTREMLEALGSFILEEIIR
jgi:predicted esterase